MGKFSEFPISNAKYFVIVPISPLREGEIRPNKIEKKT